MNGSLKVSGRKGKVGRDNRYLGGQYNARSLQLSLEELHHILVVVGISTEEDEKEEFKEVGGKQGCYNGREGGQR